MRLRTGIAAVLVAAASVASAVVVAPAQAAGWPAGGAEFREDGVRIRSCASVNCTVLGLGYRSHSVSWYCLEDYNGFVHILDNTTGVDGWSSNQLLWYYCD